MQTLAIFQEAGYITDSSVEIKNLLWPSAQQLKMCTHSQEDTLHWKRGRHPAQKRRSSYDSSKQVMSEYNNNAENDEVKK
jgi:hypothetical protein